jgi:hypothetical protein
MKVHNLSAALMSVGLFMAVPAFAQTTPARKQRTQEGGGGSMPMPCGTPFNASPGGDPDCKQRTQNLTPTPGQATIGATGKQK